MYKARLSFAQVAPTFYDDFYELPVLFVFEVALPFPDLLFILLLFRGSLLSLCKEYEHSDKSVFLATLLRNT